MRDLDLHVSRAKRGQHKVTLNARSASGGSTPCLYGLSIGSFVFEVCRPVYVGLSTFGYSALVERHPGDRFLLIIETP
jgi:hypothetical protein